MAPPKNRSGCLFFALGVVAGLVAIINGMSNDITARIAGRFFISVALVLILFGRQWSGKDVIAETRQYFERARIRNFVAAWWMITMGYIGLASLACFVIYPFTAAIMRACGRQSLALDVPGELVFLGFAALGLVSVLTRKPKAHDELKRDP